MKLRLTIYTNLIVFVLGPGISSCFYFANIDAICQLTLVEVKDLPTSCTSFFATELTVDTDFNINKPFFENYSYGKLYVTLINNKVFF